MRAYVRSYQFFLHNGTILPGKSEQTRGLLRISRARQATGGLIFTMLSWIKKIFEPSSLVRVTPTQSVAIPHKIYNQLERHEGFRSKPYKDTVGKLTIGIGRNLDDRGITREEAMHLLKNDVRECHQELSKRWPTYLTLDEVRRAVLLDMCFNLGIYGLLKFTSTLRSIQLKNYKDASHHMLRSKWASQVGSRAVRLARMMQRGEWI